MFRNKWLRMALVLTILVSLVATPLLVSAQEDFGFTGLTDGATISGVVTVTGVTPTDGYERWELLVFPGGNDSAASTIYVTGGDTLGEFSYDLDTTIFPDGDHVLALRVVRPDTNYTDFRANVTIDNAGAAPSAVAPVEEEVEVEEEVVEAEEEVAPAAAEETAAPVNGFDAEDGIEVSGTVTVTGYANTVGFDKWQMDVVPFGVADDAIFAALGEEAGEFSYVLDTTQFPDGDHQLRLRVVNDTGNYDEYFVDVTVANSEAAPVEEAEVEVAATETATETVEAQAPAAVEAPVAEARANGLDLEDGATVSGTVDVTGYADDPDFDKWDLFVLPGGDESAKIFLAQGTEAGEFTVTIDTTNFPDGDHVFSLRVVNATNGNYTEYLVPFTIANAE
jgi:hypothetical protein